MGQLFRMCTAVFVETKGLPLKKQQVFKLERAPWFRWPSSQQKVCITPMCDYWFWKFGFADPLNLGLLLPHHLLSQFAKRNGCDFCQSGYLSRSLLTKNFCKRMIDLVDSKDPRNRDYLKTILHCINGNFSQWIPQYSSHLNLHPREISIRTVLKLLLLNYVQSWTLWPLTGCQRGRATQWHWRTPWDSGNEMG